MKNFFIKFKDTIIRFLKGIVIGIAMIIPGVSGGTLAVLLGIYDTIIESINNIFKSFKKSILTLLPIFLGAVVGFVLLIIPLSYGLQHCPLIIISLFSGLIIGGIPQLYKKVQGKENPVGIILGIISISIMVILCFVVTNINISFSKLTLPIILYLILGGFLSACALVVPGISGSMIMMILGLYSPLLLVLTDILHFQNIISNTLILLPLIIGLVIGFFSISKLMGYLLKKHETNTFFSIIGFVIGSIFTIYFVTITDGEYQIDYSFISILISSICLIGGFLLTFFLEKKLSTRKETQNEIR